MCATCCHNDVKRRRRPSARFVAHWTCASDIKKSTLSFLISFPRIVDVCPRRNAIGSVVVCTQCYEELFPASSEYRAKFLVVDVLVRSLMWFFTPESIIEQDMRGILALGTSPRFPKRWPLVSHCIKTIPFSKNRKKPRARSPAKTYRTRRHVYGAYSPSPVFPVYTR